MGKSALTARTMAQLAEHYDVVIWHSLLNAPELPELLTTMLHMLPETPLPSLPDGLEALLNLFFVYLQEQRVLIVLDNVESILGPEGHGSYRDGYTPYAQLFKRIALRDHRGQVLITSRERPRGFGQLEDDLPWVRSLHLDGLDATDAVDLLQIRDVAGSDDEKAELVTRYSGNPLALKLVADTIDEVFGGELDVFLAEEAGDLRRHSFRSRRAIRARLRSGERDPVLDGAGERAAVRPTTSRTTCFIDPHFDRCWKRSATSSAVRLSNPTSRHGGARLSRNGDLDCRTWCWSILPIG